MNYFYRIIGHYGCLSLSFLLMLSFVGCSDEGSSEKSVSNDASWFLFVNGSGDYDPTQRTLTIDKGMTSTLWTDRPFHLSETIENSDAIHEFFAVILSDTDLPNATITIGTFDDHVAMVTEVTEVEDQPDRVILSLRAIPDFEGQATSLPAESLQDQTLSITVTNWDIQDAIRFAPDSSCENLRSGQVDAAAVQACMSDLKQAFAE